MLLFFLLSFEFGLSTVRGIGPSKIKREKSIDSECLIRPFLFYQYYYVDFFPVVSFSPSPNLFICLYGWLLDSSCLPGCVNFAYGCTRLQPEFFRIAFYLRVLTCTHTRTPPYWMYKGISRYFVSVGTMWWAAQKEQMIFDFFLPSPECRRNNHSKEMCCRLKGNSSGWMLCAASHLFVVFGFCHKFMRQSMATHNIIISSGDRCTWMNKTMFMCVGNWI